MEAATAGSPAGEAATAGSPAGEAVEAATAGSIFHDAQEDAAVRFSFLPQIEEFHFRPRLMSLELLPMEGYLERRQEEYGFKEATTSGTPPVEAAIAGSPAGEAATPGSPPREARTPPPVARDPAIVPARAPRFSCFCPSALFCSPSCPVLLSFP